MLLNGYRLQSRSPAAALVVAVGLGLAVSAASRLWRSEEPAERMDYGKYAHIVSAQGGSYCVANTGLVEDQMRAETTTDTIERAIDLALIN
jgi:hypothetical protein